MIEEQVVNDPNSWLTPSRASPFHQHTAFYPIIDLLEGFVLKLQSDDDLALKIRKLEDWLLQGNELDLEETLPLFKRFLSLAPDDRNLAPAQRTSEKQQTMDYLLHILFARASKQPVLFVCEEWHWADASTLEFLDLLVTRLTESGRRDGQGLSSAPVLAVFTFRPEFQAPWVGRDRVIHMSVDRLGRDPSEQIAKSILGDTRLPQEVMDTVIVRTDGNPLFIEELGRWS